MGIEGQQIKSPGGAKEGRVDLDNVNAIREVETFKKNGFVGMKFHRPQKDYDDPGYFQVSDHYSFAPILIGASIIPLVAMVLMLALIRSPKTDARGLAQPT